MSLGLGQAVPGPKHSEKLELFTEHKTGRPEGHPPLPPLGAHGAIGQMAVFELFIAAAEAQSV